MKAQPIHTQGMNGTNTHNEKTDPLWLAYALSQQPWHEIGNCEPPLAATSDLDIMVEQLTSILEFHLKQVVKKRMADDSSLTFCTDGDASDATKSFLQRNGELDGTVRRELRNYVTRVGQSYNSVHFHSFEHATHVTVSMNRLIAMLIDYDLIEKSKDGVAERKLANESGGKTRRSTMQHVECSCSGIPENGDQKKKRQGSLGGSSCGGNDDDDLDASDVSLTFGIGSDPMSRFALVFSALIHDVDHQGVSNAQLVEEFHELAIMHNDNSVLEQHSLQVAFSLMMKPEFATLKRCIMPTSADRKTFRKLVIGLVMVTDISSPDRMQLAKSKWKEAFNPYKTGSLDMVNNTQEVHAGEPCETMETAENILRRRHSMYTSQVSSRKLLKVRLGIRQSLQLGGKIIDVFAPTNDGDVQLRASAVMELMINVADVAHLMQSFDVFCKWNKCLYKELVVAYRSGRNSWDPSENWYMNQINFFDAYIIPLAEKVEMCNSFGIQGATLLYFAMENKRKWTVDGYNITLNMKDLVEAELKNENHDES